MTKTKVIPANNIVSSAAGSFTADRKGKGTREWSDSSYNICQGCTHGCLYCYAKATRARFDSTVRVAGGWENQRLKPNTELGRGHSTDEVVMFPTAHDITPEFVGESLATIRNLLADGNKVLIVTKPHLSVVRTLCRELQPNKDRILFRFTIGTLNAKLAAFWEPHAPLPSDRVMALRNAYATGFATSLSIEPMLGSVADTIGLVLWLQAYVTDTIWIGKMQRIPTKLNSQVPGFNAARDLIRKQQTDSEILRLVDSLDDSPKVRWKDSIKTVIERSNNTKTNNN